MIHLHRTVVISELIERASELMVSLGGHHHVIGHERLTDVADVRQVATLACTVAQRSLIVSHELYLCLSCALIDLFRVADRCVAYTPTTRSQRWQTSHPGAATWRTGRNLRTVFDSDLFLHYMKT